MIFGMVPFLFHVQDFASVFSQWTEYIKRSKPIKYVNSKSIFFF